ncbi:MAG: hypothetical protein M1167_04180 [Chloroflexi bacterium]|nr:hypothetical protein [Chloroflexota bacterium]
MGEMWGSHVGTSQNNWGMGGMMGDGYNGSGTTPSYLWIIPVVLIAAVATAIIGVAFYLAYPELKYIRTRGTCNPQTGSTLTHTSQISQAPAIQSKTESQPPTLPATITQNCEVLLKTMTPEEQKVFNVLVAHKGKYLQKYVVKESGLSRLKTHRIIARFTERGIVSVKEFGNTNEVTISDWANGYSV